MSRFRPNIVIEGTTAFEEDRWKTISIGSQQFEFTGSDDVFTVNPRWLDEFLPRYKAEIGMPFWCYTYPTTHNAAMLQQLKDD